MDNAAVSKEHLSYTFRNG